MPDVIIQGNNTGLYIRAKLLCILKGIVPSVNLSLIHILTGLDRETRDREGYGRTTGAFLKEIDSADSVTGLLKACLQFQRNTGLFSLMGWYYEGDSGDSSVKVLYPVSYTHLDVYKRQP